MTKICKGYIREIKAMFPIKGKNEKKYLKNLIANVEDFVIEENISDKSRLYEKFGKPIDIVAEYFSNVETAYIIKRIKFSKFIKILIAIIIAILIIVSTMFCVFEIQTQQVAIRQEAVICDEEIEINDSGEVSDEEFDKQLSSAEK